MNRLVLPAALSLSLLATAAQAGEVVYVQPPQPYKTAAFLKSTKSSKVDLSKGVLQVPLITWAADGVLVHANNGLAANNGSPLAKALGMKVQLDVIDDFDTQVKNYIAGKTPFLRGTMGMINHVAEALGEVSPDLAPVVIVQISWSTGADGFVAKGIKSLSDLKGKSIVIQANGPHVDLLQVLLEDAGLKPGDVNVKYVSEITLNPAVAKDGKAHDPANAFRNDPSLAGAACIFPDILGLTSGGNVGTGDKDSVKGARPILSTATASRVVADVYAVRRDFFNSNKDLCKKFVMALLKEQAWFRGELENIARKNRADKNRLNAFKNACKPLAKIFLQDEKLVNDFILWVGNDSKLAYYAGNVEFFSRKGNPVGFEATCQRAQNYFKECGFITKVVPVAQANWNYSVDFGRALGSAARAETTRDTFKSVQDVRKAAESKDSNQLFKYTFKFPAKMSTLRWQDYEEVFKIMHEKVSRYRGAIVQLRGHADNFFYNYCALKRNAGAKTYPHKVSAGKYKEDRLPSPEEILNSARRLSYSRAFAVKRAYAQYLMDRYEMPSSEIDLSRFHVKGMGISDPIIPSPINDEQRAQNMRGEMVIIAAEAEIPKNFDFGDF